MSHKMGRALTDCCICEADSGATENKCTKNSFNFEKSLTDTQEITALVPECQQGKPVLLLLLQDGLM